VSITEQRNPSGLMSKLFKIDKEKGTGDKKETTNISYG